VTEANVRRIRPGMTARQVEGILGRPPHWEVEQAAAVLRFELHGVREGDSLSFWDAPAGLASVIFDSAGRVVEARFEQAPRETGFFARLRAWLGW
jgi:hypothetical protein